MSTHPHVPHPRDLLRKQPGLRHHAFVPPGLGFLARWNARLAFAVAAAYGAAVTIWIFTGYTLLGVVQPKWLNTLLFWSNGIQLVFTAVMTYVGNQLAKQGQAKADADHQAQTHIATGIDEIKAALASIRRPRGGGM